LLALSLIITEPDEAPVALGEKVLVIVQCAPAFTVFPQLLVWAKAPVATMLEMFSAAVPVLVRVTGEPPLVVPTATLPKLTLVVERDAVWATDKAARATTDRAAKTQRVPRLDMPEQSHMSDTNRASLSSALEMLSSHA